MSKKRKKGFRAKPEAISGQTVIGIMIAAAQQRAANGSATPEDIDFLARVQRMSKGRDGYTGETLRDHKEGNMGGNGNGGGYQRYDKRGSGRHGYSQARNHNSGSAHFPQAGRGKDDEVFHCEESGEVTSTCPLKPYVPTILVKEDVWDTWIKLAGEFKEEWIALLKGRLGEDNQHKPAYIIESFYFPPQTASGTHVDVPTGIRPEAGVIGAVHSHVNMNCFFSATDKAHSNWPVEIVVNSRGDHAACARHKLRCGEWAKSDTKVYYTADGSWRGAIAGLNIAFDKGKRIMDGRARKGNKGGSTDEVHPEDKEESPVNPAAALGPALPDSQPTTTAITVVPPATTMEGSSSSTGSNGQGELADAFQVLAGGDASHDEPVDPKYLCANPRCEDGFVQGADSKVWIRCDECNGTGLSKAGQDQALEQDMRFGWGM